MSTYADVSSVHNDSCHVRGAIPPHVGYGMRGPRNTSCAATCWYVAPRSGLDNLGVKYDTRAEVREV